MFSKQSKDNNSEYPELSNLIVGSIAFIFTLATTKTIIISLQTSYLIAFFNGLCFYTAYRIYRNIQYFHSLRTYLKQDLFTKSILIISVICGTILALRFPWIGFILTINFLIGIFYIKIPFTKNHSLRKIPYLKNMWTASVWTLQTTLIPFLLINQEINFELILINFILFFVSIIPFDISDKSIDAKELKTIVNQFGINTSKTISIILMLSVLGLTISNKNTLFNLSILHFGVVVLLSKENASNHFKNYSEISLLMIGSSSLF